MSNVQIPNLASATSLSGSEQLEAVQSGTSVKVTTAQIAALAAPIASGTVTSITAGTGLSGGTITTSGTIAIATTGTTTGSFGSSSAIPTFTVNGQGQLTAAGSVGTNTITSVGTLTSGAIGSGFTAIPNSALANSTISGVALGGTLANLTAGTHLSGGPYNGSGAVTLSTDATSANTASTIVARDSSGNFSAGTITASLNGSATSATAATTADNLALGAANRIAYQTGSGATSFIVAPTTASTFLEWTGSTFAWVAGGGGGGTTIGAPVSGGTAGYGLYVDSSTNLGQFAYGTGVFSALAVNTGTAGAFVVNGGALGTPSSGTLTNATGLPVGGISATGTPSSTTYLRGDGSWQTISTGLTVGTTPTSGGAAGQIMFDTGSVLQESSNLVWDNTNKALTLGGGTVTTSNPVLNLSQTWNASAVTFTGLKFNVTNTASAAASLLMDLQVGGTSQFSVRNDGKITLPGGTVSYANGDITISSGKISASGADVYIHTGSYGYIRFNNANTNIALNGGLGFGFAAADPGSTATLDVALYRDAAGILAQRNGTNAQTYRAYNTYTNSSNYEVGVFDWQTTTNVLTIGTQNAGTGSARDMAFSSATGRIQVLGGTVTTSQPAFDISQTWNAGAVTFTGLKFNVTNTASAAASLLMDLQIGGSSKFSVNKAGAATANGVYSSAVYSSPSGSNIWLRLNEANASFDFFKGAGSLAQLRNNGNGFCFSLDSSAFLSFSSTTADGVGDARLYRDAAGILAQRNGTSAQTFRVYNAYTNSSNYDVGVFDWQTTTNVLTIGTQNIGTYATARYIKLTSATKAIQYDTTTVASLPAAATAGAGARAFVTDALTPVFGSAVTGGGAVKVPVYSDGSTWLVG